MDQTTQATLELLKNAPAIDPGILAKAGIATSLGLVGYSLEAGAKLIYPVLTPLRNIIPRVGQTTPMAGTALNWKAITGINTANVRAGVSEGNRNAAISFTEVDRTASFKGIGLENFVTFEADYSARGFDDARALAVQSDLQALMIQEEQIILHGNATFPLGTTPTPTGVAASGGTIAISATNFLYCVALTWDGYNGNGASQNPVSSLGVLVPIIARTNVDASTDSFGGGTAQISAVSAAITTTSGNQTVVGTVAPVKGAFGYAWFLGVTAGAANAFLVAITNLPTATITAAATSTYAANATGLNADHSVNALIFDGLITQGLALSGYYKSLSGGTLTADGTGGVVEIDAALKYFWDTFKLTPNTIWVDSQCIKDITKKVASSAAPAYRINVSSGAGGQGTMTAGSLVTSYLNKFALAGAVEIPVRLHPFAAVGTIYFDLDTNPYPNSRVPVPRRIRTRQEYYQLEWPLRTRKYEYGVYADELLQMYLGFGTGVITDIAPG